MAGTTVEERLATVEQELARLKQQLATDKPQTATPWWKKIVGVYKNDPEFDAAERLGREYREALRPQEDEESGYVEEIL